MNKEISQLSEKEIEDLVIKSQQGDADAFGQIYDVFVTPIYRYIFYKVKREDVEDLVEVLFLKAWENIKKYKKQEKTSFKSWVFRIAHNLVVDHYRLTREHAPLDPRLSDTKRDSDPVKQVKLNLNNERLREAISQLKPNYQQIVTLKFINELSNEEIGNILNKSEGSVRILQFRALKVLKGILQDMGVHEYE